MPLRLNSIILLLLLSIVSCKQKEKNNIPDQRIQNIINKAESLSIAGRLEERDSLIMNSIVQLKEVSDLNGLFLIYKWYLNEYEFQNKEFASQCAKDYYSRAHYLEKKEDIFYSCY